MSKNLQRQSRVISIVYLLTITLTKLYIFLELWCPRFGLSDDWWDSQVKSDSGIYWRRKRGYSMYCMYHYYIRQILNRIVHSQLCYLLVYCKDFLSIEATSVALKLLSSFFLGPAPDLNIPCLAFSKRLLPRDHHSNPMQMTSIISFPWF